MSAHPRDDFFTLIHKGLRGGMLDLYLEAGRLDWHDAEAVADFRRRWATLSMLLRSHAHHEDDFIWPLIESKRPGTIAELGVSHEPVDADLGVVDAVLADVVRDPTPQKGLTFYRALGWFTADMLDHFAAEEPAITEMLWAHCTDAELGECRGRFMSSMNPEEAAGGFTLILRHSTHAEQVAVIGGMHASMPPEAFTGWVEGMAASLDPDTERGLRGLVTEVAAAAV